MVSTSDCGSENPGSNPGSGNFFIFLQLDFVIFYSIYKDKDQLFLINYSKDSNF